MTERCAWYQDRPTMIHAILSPIDWSSVSRSMLNELLAVKICETVCPRLYGPMLTCPCGAVVWDMRTCTRPGALPWRELPLIDSDDCTVVRSE